MPEPPCANPQCGHPYPVHVEELRCRVTRCECQRYVEPDDEPAAPEPRRLVIEIPAGYAVTVQLVPLTDGADLQPLT